MSRRGRKHIDIANMPVMPVQCATCPFREEGDPDLRLQIMQRVMSDGSQTCHHTGLIHGREDTHLCRGARDYQLQVFCQLGVISAPTDEAWSAAWAAIKAERTPAGG